MKVEVNTFDFATEGVLSIKCKDKKQRIAAYISKLLNEAKKNYEIHDKELLNVQKHEGISQKELRVILRFGHIIKTWSTL